jgi:fatty acid desaturase
MLKPEDHLKEQEWYVPDLARKELKTYLKRDNRHAILSFGLWLILMGGFGYLAVISWGYWWAIPVFFLYGVVYSSANARWHECSHGTPFKTNWLNEVFYFIGGSMEFRDNIDFRWSHARHHSFTMMSIVDPEIPLKRPPNWGKVILDVCYLYSGIIAMRNIVLHSFGIVTRSVRSYVPEEEFKAMFWWARAALIPHLIAIALSLWMRSWIPVLLYGLPRFYGSVVQWTFILLQHAGLPENIWDHRLTCRSFKLNPILSFLFMNMEHHIEHHLHPMVPFHALPRLSERIHEELPIPYRGLVNPVKELLPVLAGQSKNPELSIDRPLPEDGDE